MEGFENVQSEFRAVTLFQYSSAVIIDAIYSNFVPLGNFMCVVLMEAPILANSFLVVSIVVWIVWTITLVVIFARIYLMVLSCNVIKSCNSLGPFSP